MRCQELTQDQQSAFEQFRRWHYSDASSWFAIGGYAGTGKTTLIKEIYDNTSDVAVMAYTGKAVQVLRSRGIPDAATIHSTIYDFIPSNSKATEGHFVLKPYVSASLFVIDEASMIHEQLWKDLQSFNIPILVVGDPGQLEPVGKDIYLMAEPDCVLSQIVRQAEGNPIIRLASDIRNDLDIWDDGDYESESGSVTIRHSSEFSNFIDKADRMICGYNNTRTSLNKRYRELSSRNKSIPEPGEEIIALRNDKRCQIFNGDIITVNECWRFKDRDGKLGICGYVNGDDTNERFFMASDIALGTPKLTEKDKAEIKYGTLIFDYAYCLTAHKAQGSSWPTVAVYDEPVGDPIRWLYTAVTRAEKHLILCTE